MNDQWINDIIEAYSDKTRRPVDTIIVDLEELLPRLTELRQRRTRGLDVSEVERNGWKERVTHDGKTIDRLMEDVERERKRSEGLKNKLDTAGRALSRIARAHDGGDALTFCKSIARDAIIYQGGTLCAPTKESIECLEAAASAQRDEIASLKARVDGLRGDTSDGPFERCHNCDRDMVWSYAGGSWMCPRCTLRNLDDLRDCWRRFWAGLTKKFWTWEHDEWSPYGIINWIKTHTAVTMRTPAADASVEPKEHP